MREEPKDEEICQSKNTITSWVDTGIDRVLIIVVDNRFKKTDY